MHWYRQVGLMATFAIAATLANPSYAQEAEPELEPWKLKRDKQGIQIYTRSVPGSKFKAVQATMVIPGRLSELVGLILDVDACPRWADLCKSASVHEKLSPTEYYIYTYNDVPWPVKDRDMVAHIRWSQDPETLAVHMKAVATEGLIPKVKSAVRVKQATTGWRFAPQADGLVEVTMSAHVDPAGPTPAWLTNLLLVDTPYKTLKNMRKIIGTGEYRDSIVEFVNEPNN